MIGVGIWMIRCARQFEDQWRKELYFQWEINRGNTENALDQIGSIKKERVQLLQVMSDKINLEENKRESVLRDFKEMLSNFSRDI